MARTDLLEEMLHEIVLSRAMEVIFVGLPTPGPHFGWDPTFSCRSILECFNRIGSRLSDCSRAQQQPAGAHSVVSEQSDAARADAGGERRRQEAVFIQTRDENKFMQNSETKVCKPTADRMHYSDILCI
ncbi:hypothetical protein VOM14_10705 [Paraburkholderia sp. MPAMCS5]|uniref:hypothetical protein n=1 Tax=Paraburkholderia sp. MPAMCS5 TaxID=3112563 RepID=UPI002E19B2CF|nr:hypothetical protein [Paraburkholderia sp. MPAMCS5]